MGLFNLLLVHVVIVIGLLSGLINLTTAQIVSADIFQSGSSSSYAAGSIATIVCSVTNYDEDLHVVKITRTKNTSTTILLFDNEVLDTAPANVEFVTAGKPQPDSLDTWTIIDINGVSELDAGLFTCYVYERGNIIATDTVDVRVQYVPIPQCSLSATTSSETDDSYHVGDILNLSCVSELGSPTAYLSWSVSANGPGLPAAESTTGTDLLSIRVSVTLTSSHNRVAYLCFASSSAGIPQSCTLGPFTVLSVVNDPTTQGLSTSTPTTSMEITQRPPSSILTTFSTATTLDDMQRNSDASTTRKSLLTTARSRSAEPLFSSTVAAIVTSIIVIIIIIAVVLIIILLKPRCGKYIFRRMKTHDRSQVTSGFNGNIEGKSSQDGDHVHYSSAQDTATVQHVKAAPGVLYAVVDKRKSQEILSAVQNGTAPSNDLKNVVDQSDAENKKQVHDEPALYASVDEMPRTDSPSHYKRASSTTTTPVLCSEDTSQDHTNDTTPYATSSHATVPVSCSEDTNNKYIYETVNQMDDKVDNKDGSSISNQTELPSKDTNIEGLQYADLDLPQPRDNECAIISAYESTAYADVSI